MRKSILPRFVLSGFVGLAGLSAVSQIQAAVVYREIFPVPSDQSNKGWEQAGWQSYYGDDAIPATKKTPTYDQLGYTRVDGSALGLPTDLPAIDSNPVISGLEDQSFFYAGNGSGGTNPLNDVKYFIWTDEYEVNRSVNEVDKISWYQGNETKTDEDRVAIRIGSQWYVSTAVFTQSVGVGTKGNFNGKAEQKIFTFTTDKSAWNELNFTADSAGGLSIGAALSADLPSGNITAFGLYTDNKTKTFRFDTYEISAVPEPSAVGLLSLGGLLLMRKR